MGKINMGRCVIGGLLAGLVMNIGEYILNEPILGQDWKAVAERYGLPEMGGSTIILYIVWEFIMGIALIWLYAAIRPRFGAGPKTAIMSGAAVWFLVWFMGFGGSAIGGMFPSSLVLITLVWGLFEVPISALAGAWLYREEEGAVIKD